jgi:endonuclease V-like protein UPF0215 family
MKPNLFKKETRILGIDDGPYLRDADRTPLVMTLMRATGMIEGFIGSSIETDGHDSSRVIARELESSRFGDQVRCIISDGACLGGFNVLDLGDLHERTGVPVITASDETPEPDLMRRTMTELFPDGAERYELVSAYPAHAIELRDGTCYIRVKGITVEEASRLIGRVTFHGRTPEPVRISHMVASLCGRGGIQDG